MQQNTNMISETGKNEKAFTESMLNYLQLSKDSTTVTATATAAATEVNSDDSLEDTLYTDSSDEESRQLFKDKASCGNWAANVFEKYPWAEKKRPYVRIRRYKNLKKFSDEEVYGKLTERIIACCLTHLEKSPYDLKFALCKCKLQDKSLIDISALRSYHYIQYLNLSKNNITTLVALSEMPFLQHLDASFNAIEQSFDFRPPFYLTNVNYSNNKIVVIPNLDKFWSIVNLDLSHNGIREIKGLENLKYLTNLNISHNKIRMLENLNNLNLDTLNIRNNNICMYQQNSKTVGFHTLKRLRILDVRSNNMSTMAFLKNNYNLENVYMSENEINKLEELFHLERLNNLKALDLEENGVIQLPHFFNVCLRICKRLQSLNNCKVTTAQKIRARTKEDINPSYPAFVARTHLMLLNMINRPNIVPNMCPLTRPRPNLMLMIGPPSCRKGAIVGSLIEKNKLLKLGVSYTTRPKRRDEITGKEYYFIRHDLFAEMIRKAEFICVSEFNGNLYGITYKELEKGIDAILIFFCNLDAALTIKATGIEPKMILALPEDEQTHVQWIKYSYFFDRPEMLDLNEVKVTNCPTKIRNARSFSNDERCEEDLFPNMSLLMDEISYDESNLSTEMLHPPVNLIFKPLHSESSMESCIIESQRHILNSQNRIVDAGKSEKKVKRNANDSGDNRKSSNKVPGVPQKDFTLSTSFTLNTNIKNESCKKPYRLSIPCANETVTVSNVIDSGDLSTFEICQLKKDISIGNLLEMYPNILSDTTTLGSNTESFPKERLHEKRVSFNKVDQLDEYERWSGATSTNEHRMPLGSISNTHILAGMKTKFDDNPLLSALSSCQLHESLVKPSKTVYTSMSERFNTMQTEKLAPFIEKVLNLRKKLLELHFQNPGLFHLVIFTDWKQQSINALHELAKTTIRNMKSNINSQSRRDRDFERDPMFQKVINKKLNKLNIYRTPFVTVYTEDGFDKKFDI